MWKKGQDVGCVAFAEAELVSHGCLPSSAARPAPRASAGQGERRVDARECLQGIRICGGRGRDFVWFSFDVVLAGGAIVFRREGCGVVVVAALGEGGEGVAWDGVEGGRGG